MAEDKTSIGTWLSPEDLRAFDDVMTRRTEGHYSRSAKIRDAMALYQTVEEVFADQGITFEAERDKRFFVRQAIQRELDRDADG